MADKKAVTTEEPARVVIDGKTYVKRKPRISISDMLANGSPESQGRPRTMMETFGYPVIMAVLFGISLLIFHHAPHSYSRASLNQGFSMNQKPVSKATIQTVLEEARLKKAAEVKMESIEVEVPGETTEATEPLQVYTEMPNEL